MRRRLALLLGLLVLVLFAAWWRGRGPAGRRAPDAPEKTVAASYLALEAREQEADRTVWAPELEAERCEDEFIRLWDALNGSAEPWGVLGAASPAELAPSLGAVESLPHGIQRWRWTAATAGSSPGAGPALTNAIRGWEAAGWRLGRTTWHLAGHQTAADGAPARSLVRFTAQLERAAPPARAYVEGAGEATWEDARQGAPRLTGFRFTEGVTLLRNGPPAFRSWLDEELPLSVPLLFDPLLSLDLDGDGRSELMLIGGDRLWRLGAPSVGRPGAWAGEPFLGLPPSLARAAVLADLDGDGRADLVLAEADGVRVLRGRPGGFQSPGELVWRAPRPLRHPQTIAVADVNGDGRPDLWVAQYKLPYQGGQFPTPYYDADDGFPSYLLLADGHGGFTDATEASGLGPHRRRRAYAAAFIDINRSGRPALVTVSDFAGLEAYLGDGAGHFRDVSEQWGESRRGFGMALAVADLNHDGLPDLLMLGMDSSVAARMDALGLNRSRSGLEAGREGMIYGNRLFLSRPGASPAEPPWSAASGGVAAAVRHTGWSWGAAWCDLDNDGRLDLCVAAGHETRASTLDYERQFWRHDIYVGGSDPDPVRDAYFRSAAGRRQAAGASYGGWQDNACRLQVAPGEFIEAAWLLGLTTGADTHNLLAEDFDGDGRVDLAFTTFEEWPRPRRRLIVLRNELPDAGNWVGFRFDRQGAVPLGLELELRDSTGSQTSWVLAGPGYRSQGAPALHFGLGASRPVEARVRWRSGISQVVPALVGGEWRWLSSPPR